MLHLIVNILMTQLLQLVVHWPVTHCEETIYKSEYVLNGTDSNSDNSLKQDKRRKVTCLRHGVHTVKVV
eukprot:UN00964